MSRRPTIFCRPQELYAPTPSQNFSIDFKPIARTGEGDARLARGLLSVSGAPMDGAESEAAMSRGMSGASRHAQRRMSQRAIQPDDVELARAYGRLVHARGAAFHVIGRREVRAAAIDGIDLRRLEGLHVVEARAGDVLTVYRNRNLRGLRHAPRWR